MEYAFLVFVALVLWHFVYEGIIAPSLRMERRYRLFELRDGLRLARIRQPEISATKHFDYLQDSLNGLIHHADRIDITAFVACKRRMDTDKAFRERLMARVKWLSECRMPVVQETSKRLVNTVDQLVAVNNGAWFIYIVPAVAVAACYQWMIESARDLISLSERDLEKVAIPSPERRLV